MQFNDYKKLSLANDVVILTTVDKEEEDKRKVPEKGLQILLIKRDEEPFLNKWSLPGGFVDYDKDIDTCVKEKLYAKTGITDLYMEQLYTYGAVDRDIRGRVVSVAYMALVKKEDVITQIQNTEETNKESEWFWIEPKRDSENHVVDIQLVSEKGSVVIKDLVFDHKNIIIDALNRLQNKIEYTDIAFNLVSKYFTVKELQMVYECILGRKIQAFRRKISDKIEPTEMMKDDGSAYRPAQLYKFNNKRKF
jgi:ADP-ribose pyrophosphatase YjhB (NUDIX family)